MTVVKYTGLNERGLDVVDDKVAVAGTGGPGDGVRVVFFECLRRGIDEREWAEAIQELCCLGRTDEEVIGLLTGQLETIYGF